MGLGVLKVLVSGQSNSIGVGTGGASVVDGRVKVWNNVNPLGAIGSAFIDPVLGSAPFQTWGYGDSNNFGIWFCDRLAKEFNTTVNMTLVGQASMSISEWIVSDNSVAPQRDQIAAVWAATGQGVADIFLWHQGEADTYTKNYAQYNACFIEMLALLTTAGVIDANTKIVIGGLDETTTGFADFNNNVLRPVALSHANVFYASSTGLTADVNWPGHFSGEALYQLGNERYWNAVREALEIAKPPLNEIRYLGQRLGELISAIDEKEVECDCPPSGGGGSWVDGGEVTLSGNSTVISTAIPETAQQVVLTFNGVSNNAAVLNFLQLGAASFETSGYKGSSGVFLGSNNTAPSAAYDGSAFMIYLAAAEALVYGTVTLTRHSDSNTWMIGGQLSGVGVAATVVMAGAKTLSGALTSVRIGTAPSYSLDGGTIGIKWM